MDVAVLGPLTVDGSADALGPRDRVVLAALALGPHEPVTAERLADALWGDSPPASWPKVVQGCVVRIRKVLGADAVQTTPHGYVLSLPDDALDARRFGRLLDRGRELLEVGEPERAHFTLTQALELWTGPAFPELEGWEPAEVAATRLSEQRRDGEELRVEAALRAGRWREVLAEAAAMTAEQPLRERRWALLARAQYQAGRQGEALATLQRARSVLVHELGLDPGPELVSLEQAILQQDPALLPQPQPSTSVQCPYQGLLSYGVEQAEVFYGRDREVAACRSVLDRHGVLAVVGASGSGKSSLVQAGVAAALLRDGEPTTVVTPGAHPLTALTQAGVPHSRTTLVVDQLEEVLSQSEDPADRELFLDALVGHVERGGRLVVAVRADRLGPLTAHAEFARLLERGMHLLGPMTEDDLRAAVEGPARHAGLLLEGGLVDLLVREVEGEPGALPMLSHALAQTWERRQGRTLTVAGYRAAGGISGAVAQTAEEVFQRLPGPQQSALRDLLLRLTTPNHDGDPLRRRVPRRMVATDHVHATLVEMLVSARLVTSDGDAVELAHEALARAWPRLRSWLDDDVEGQRILRHLAIAADSWDAMGRPPSELYRGVRLARALEWQARTVPDLTSVEQAFLGDSRRLAEAEERSAERRAQEQAAVNRRLRRQRWLLAAALAAAMVLSVVAVERGVSANRNSVAAEARAEAATAGLLAEADDVSDSDWPLSVLLATEARRIADSPLTRRGQLAALTSPRPVGTTLAENPAGYQALAVDDDAGLVAVNDPDGSLTVHDLATGEVVHGPLGAPVFPYAGGVDLHGDLVAAAGLSVDGTGAVVYAMGQDEPVATFETAVERDSTVAFSPRGDRLAVSSPGQVRIVSTADWSVVDTLVTGNGDDPLLSVAWSGDGTRVYAGSFPAVYAWSLDAAGTDERTPSGRIELAPPDDPSVLSLAAVPGSHRIAATTFGGASYLLADDPLRVIEGPLLHDNITLDAAVSDDGSLLAVAAFDSTDVWALDANPAGVPVRVTSVPTDSVNVAFTEGGDLLTVGEDGRLSRWVLDPPSPVLSEAERLGPGVPTFSPGGELLAMWGFGKGVRLFDGTTLEPVTSIDLADAETASIGGVAFTPDSTRVAVLWCVGTQIEAREYCEADLATYDTTTGQVSAGPVRTPPISHWTPSVVAVSADGRTVATGHAGGLVRLYDAETLEPLGTLDDTSDSPEAVHVIDVDFADHAPLLAASTGLDTAVWDLSGDEPALLQRGRVGLTSTFTPAGDLVTSTQSGTVAVRDPRTFEVLAQAEGLPASLTTPGVDADGALMVTTDDGTGAVRVWSLPDLALVAGPLDGPYYADINADGSLVVLGSTTSSLLTLDADAWDDAACRVAGRNLTTEEWQRYFPGEPYRETCPGVEPA